MHQIDNDHLGRPELITNANKAIVWQSNNDPFGGMNPTTNTLGEFNIGLPGQYFDAESNYWYNVNRYYVPAIGRYLQADPAGLAGGLNPYSYVAGNPVAFVDPSGLTWEYNSQMGQLSQNGNVVGYGYSGNGLGMNNPAMQSVNSVGPIPNDTYIIGPQQLNVTSAKTKLPASMRLMPFSTNDMQGRKGFLIHGDNSDRDQSASEGCPILNKDIRDQIGSSGDNTLEVFSTQPWPLMSAPWDGL